MTMPTRMRGADILVRALTDAGAERVFTVSGNHVMSVFDAVIDTRLELVHVRHEAAAVFMADAWGRLTGQPGIALVTGGPGHANALGPLYTARESESPLVLLSGHAPLGEIGRGAFQEMRQADLAAPLCKASWTAQSIGGLREDIARAFRIATTGRPGPVHISLPTDLLESSILSNSLPASQPGEFSSAIKTLSAENAEATVGALRRAKRPLIIGGPTLVRRRGQIQSLAAATQIPAFSFDSPRGTSDPSLGALAEILLQADLILLLGKHLDFTLGFGTAPAIDPRCKFIHIDPESDTLDRTRRALRREDRLLLSAQADVLAAADRIIEAAAGRPAPGSDWFNEVTSAIQYRPAEWSSSEHRGGFIDGQVHPLDVFKAVRTLMSGMPDPVLVLDGGEFAQWARACLSAPRSLTNGPGGAIGGGIPFAIAARLACPHSPVIAPLGDGTFGFHMAEFETAIRHQLPFLAIVGNDAAWNAEHQLQLRLYGANRTIGCELLPSRYDQVVAALGGHGEFVTRADQLPGALERALASGKPACINVMIERVAAPRLRRTG